MNRISLLIAAVVSISLTLSSTVWAHGENKHGPHGGVIRMPGAFHTEVKEKGKAAFELYVLDMEWKNPVVQGSTLSAKWKPKGKKDVGLVCKPKQKSFFCELPKGARLGPGDIVTIQATRAGMPGAAVTYEYPFRPTPVSAGDSHDGH